MESLYADSQWSKIASDEQFEQIMALMSEYFGMIENEGKSNKYLNMPRYLLA